MRDPKTENYLKAGRFQFEFHEAIPTKRVDMTEARANPARMLRRIDDDRVLAYGIAMEEGTDFPAIVTFDIGAEKLLLCTGLHRLEAKSAAKQHTIDAYVVTESVDYRRDYLTRAINGLEGSAPSLTEKLAHVAELMRAYPSTASVKDLAAGFGLKVPTIHLYLKQAEAEERSVRLGIADAFCSLPQQAKVLLNRIHNDNNFMAAVLCVSNRKIRGTDVESFAKEVAEAKTEAIGRELIAERDAEMAEREDAAKAKYGSTKPAASTKFLSKVKTVLKSGDIAKLGLNGILPKDVDAAVTVLEETIELLTKALKVVKRRQEIMENTKWQAHGKHGSASGLHPT